MKSQILAAEGGVLLILGAADSFTGRMLGSAILLALGCLALTCAWLRWPTDR